MNAEDQEKKAKNHEVVECFLAGKEALGVNLSSRRTSGGLALFSYEEPIALRAARRLHLDVELEWKYSRTTTRHRKLLMQLAGARFKFSAIDRESIRARAGLNPMAPPPRILSGWAK